MTESGAYRVPLAGPIDKSLGLWFAGDITTEKIVLKANANAAGKGKVDMSKDLGVAMTDTRTGENNEELRTDMGDT